MKKGISRIKHVYFYLFQKFIKFSHNRTCHQWPKIKNQIINPMAQKLNYLNKTQLKVKNN